MAGLGALLLPAEDDEDLGRAALVARARRFIEAVEAGDAEALADVLAEEEDEEDELDLEA